MKEYKNLKYKFWTNTNRNSYAIDYNCRIEETVGEDTFSTEWTVSINKGNIEKLPTSVRDISLDKLYIYSEFIQYVLLENSIK